MPRIANLTGALLLTSTLAAPAWALTITGGAFDGTDVGGLDTFIIATDTLTNSSPATETTFVSGQLGADATFLGKTDPSNLYQIAENTNYFAVQLANDPGYYLVKNATWWALFQNVASLDWGVFDASLLPAGMNIGDTTVSHVSEFNAETSPFIPVPIPGSLMLLGAGLVAAGWMQHRRAR